MTTPFSIKDIDKLLVKELQQKLDEYNQPYGKKDTKPVLQNKLRAYMESNIASSSTANPKSKTRKASSNSFLFKPVLTTNKMNEEFVNLFKTGANRDTKKAKYVLENIKDFNIQDENGATALHWAVRNNDVEAVTFLLSKQGINKEIKAKDGGTPLHWGAYDAHDGSAVEELLKANVNKEAVNKDGNTPLVVALNPQSNMDFMKYVSQITKKYPITRGREEVQWNVAKILLDAGAEMAPWSKIYDDDPDDKRYTTPLMAHFISSMYLNKELYFKIIKFLLQYKPNLEERDGSYGTLLMIAVYHNRESIVELLLEAGANINATDDEGNTPLIQASMEDRKIDIVKRLLKHGADVNVMNKEKQSAFFIALHRGNIDICKLLLQNKAKHIPYYYEDMDNVYIQNYLDRLLRRPGTVRDIKQKLLDAGLIFMRPPKFSIAKTENDIEMMCKNNYKLYADEEDYNCPITYSKLEPEHTIIIRSKNEGNDDIIWCYSLEGMLGLIESIDRLPSIQRKYRNPQTTEEFSREEVDTLKQILQEYKTKIAQLPATTGGRNKTKKKKTLTITSRQMRLIRFLQQKNKKKDKNNKIKR